MNLMPGSASLNPAAIGVRVKSGRAMAVLLAGPVTAPTVVDCRTVQLADPAVPESVQPYHAGLELQAGEGAKEVARLVQVVQHFAGRSVAALIQHYRDAGHQIVGMGIVGGSDINPATIKNDHIRAHAEEGRLFRVVVEDAAKKCGLAATVTVEKKLVAKAAGVLGRPESRLKKDVAALGRGLGIPWRAEEKAATLAAWMALASGT